MPYRPARPCAVCGTLTDNKDRLCDVHLKQRNERLDTRRGTSAERGYGRRWNTARTMYLAEHPLCVQCKAKGNTVPATTVDHITPHNGNYELMWDPANWQALCTRHHSIKTASQDGAFGNRETRKVGG